MRPDLPGEAADFVAHLEGAGPLADFAGANFLQRKTERQLLLENLEIRNRVRLALNLSRPRARNGRTWRAPSSRNPPKD